ncbi:hypothetical protein CYMTET_46578 [Cymbomonas tetramitiformis]|uniref:Uncharacterized protein n=1 Tax=Cymbomonas tetramitiformis TaxID=36881 RepID=A0AAE0BXS9_9CHLO|nr:hypothetical protein CYMTET_46578 [Cymbomonas tetramitiformis]
MIDQCIEYGSMVVHSIFQERLGEEVAKDTDARAKVHQPICLLNCGIPKTEYQLAGKKELCDCHEPVTEVPKKYSKTAKRTKETQSAAYREAEASMKLAKKQELQHRQHENAVREEQWRSEWEAAIAVGKPKPKKLEMLKPPPRPPPKPLSELARSVVVCQASGAKLHEIEHRAYRVGKAIYWEQRCGDQVWETRFDFGMACIAFVEDPNREVYHKELKQYFLVRDHPDVRFMLSTQEEDVAFHY